MSRMTEEDWEFLRAFTAGYEVHVTLQGRYPMCRLCGNDITYKPVQLSRTKLPSLNAQPWFVIPSGQAKRAISRHMKKHVERFSSKQRRQFLAALALGADHGDACDEILQWPSECESFIQFFSSATPNTQGVPDATNERETGQPNEEARLHPAGPGGGALRDVPHGGEDVADR